MIQDFRYAFRQLRKHIGFTVVAVLTLGLGIGAAAAMFGLIEGVLLSPPPYAKPDRLVLVSPTRVDGAPYTQGSSIAHWLAWRGSHTIEAPALYGWRFNFLVLPDGSESLGGMAVTKNYFRVLGITPMLGREFLESEAQRPKVPPTGIIIGYELWKRRFNSDPKIIGTTLRISRAPAPLPIVGVMPPGVRFLPDPGAAAEPNYDVNASVDFFYCVIPDETQLEQRGWNAVARLRDGATAAQAQAELATMTRNVGRATPRFDGLTANVRTVPEELNRDGRRLLLPLFGSVALLFLIACGNVAGLLLARGLQRQQEYAVRSALGARRWRIVRMVLTESVALALVGGLAGAAVASGLVMLLKAIAGHAVPRIDAVTVGWPVFAFGFFAALAAAMFAGLLPAARASSSDRVQGMEGTRTSAGRAERRLLGVVTTMQIVMTVALLAGAALLVRTAYNLASVSPGYDTEHILALTVTAVGAPERRQPFHEQALQRVSALTGVRRAAFVWGLPLTGNNWPGEVEIVGESGSSAVTDRISLPLRSVTPDYFDAMSMAIVDGRAFRTTDDPKAPRVAIVNETFARRYLRGVNPIGRKLRFAGDEKNPPFEIIGVVADTRTASLTRQAEPEFYTSYWQQSAFSKHLIVRTAADPLTLAAQVRRELHAIDPTAAVEHVTTMGEIRRASVAAQTFAMHLLSGFSVAATLLALVGLYGVLSLSVGSRTKEIAVRKAIGAQRYEILRLVIGEGSRLIVLGATLGVIVALLLGPVLGSLLFEVRPADVLTLGGAAVLFCATALVACAVPAWRAARIDLMEALRHQ
jgi:putative ABC transport system permease protein